MFASGANGVDVCKPNLQVTTKCVMTNLNHVEFLTAAVDTLSLAECIKSKSISKSKAATLATLPVVV